MPERDIVGTCTIPLAEWVQMRIAEKQAKKLMAQTKEALSYVEVMLTSLSKEKAVAEAMRSVNDQLRIPLFTVSDGSIKINLPDEAQENPKAG